MDTDIVIGKTSVKGLAAIGGHVAGQAPADRADRANGEGGAGGGWWVTRGRKFVLPTLSNFVLRTFARMASQALLLIKRRRVLGVMMRVVAGGAVERTVAGGIATAPGEGGRLKTDPEWIIAWNRRFLMVAVTLAAKPHPGLARGCGGIHDRRVGEQGLHCLDVIAAGPMAALAADSAVAGLRPDVLQHGTGGSRVAEQAFVDAIGGLQRLAEAPAPRSSLAEWPVVRTQPDSCPD